MFFVFFFVCYCWNFHSRPKISIFIWCPFCRRCSVSDVDSLEALKRCRSVSEQLQAKDNHCIIFLAQFPPGSKVNAVNLSSGWLNWGHLLLLLFFFLSLLPMKRFDTSVTSHVCVDEETVMEAVSQRFVSADGLKQSVEKCLGFFFLTRRWVPRFQQPRCSRQIRRFSARVSQSWSFWRRVDKFNRRLESS